MVYLVETALITPLPQVGRHGIAGWFSFGEAYDWAVKYLGASVRGVEVGCWEGRSTAHLAELIKASGGGILYAVDTWAGSVDQPDLQQWARDRDIYAAFLANMIRLGFLGSPVVPIRLPSVVAASLFVDESLDLVSLDASHDYESVRDDILAWRPKVRRGGVLMGDDMHFPLHPGVARAVDEFVGRCRVIDQAWVTIV